jgi:hypothetical protein
MKCIKNQKTGETRKVTNEQAYSLESKGWNYISKTEWKNITSVVDSKQQDTIVENKSKKIKKRVGRTKNLS